jgi:hypothetical protein
MNRDIDRPLRDWEWRSDMIEWAVRFQLGSPAPTSIRAGTSFQRFEAKLLAAVNMDEKTIAPPMKWARLTRSAS